MVVLLGMVLLFELDVLLAALVLVVVVVLLMVLLAVLGVVDPDLLRTWIKPKVAAGVGLSELNRVAGIIATKLDLIALHSSSLNFCKRADPQSAGRQR